MSDRWCQANYGAASKKFKITIPNGPSRLSTGTLASSSLYDDLPLRADRLRRKTTHRAS